MIKIESVHIGKVRNSVILNQEQNLNEKIRIVETTDRISAFDFIFPFNIENKAKILQSMSILAFESTQHIIENHMIGALDETHILVKNAFVFPVEIIVRGYLAGSLWRLYSKNGPQGVLNEYGISLPENMIQNQKLISPILTPSTKAISGHDVPISLEKAQEIVGEKYWKLIEQKAFELFEFGSRQAQEKNLILVDTKYEMGLYKDKLILVDEIHTPDSSRYWYKTDENASTPKQISKEFLREELMELLGSPEEMKINPLRHPIMQDINVTNNLSQKVSKRYEELFVAFTGLKKTSDVYKTNSFYPWPIDKTLFALTIKNNILPGKILVVGNGGRDYVIASEISKLPEVDTVYCASGNRNWKNSKFLNCPIAQIEGIAKFAHENKVELVIAGPEVPIAHGLEKFCSHLNIPVLAPTLECASLESSKIFCKQLIESAGVKTAKSQVETWQSLKILLESESIPLPSVIKYDSLAGGKGVFVLKNKKDIHTAKEDIEQNLNSWKKLSNEILTQTYSKNKDEPCFLVEEMIDGDEFSAIALCNGENFRLLPIAKDYKRRNNDQEGPNTGGMGSIAPICLSAELLEQVQTCFDLTLKELMKRGTPYTGFLFAGFMVDKAKTAYLLEYNCRLGDPETQVVLPSLGREFYAELFKTAKKEPFLSPEKSGTFFEYDNLNRIFVVGASPEYPNFIVPTRKLIAPFTSYDTSDVHIDFIPSAIESNNMTSGGRAFGVLAASNTLERAKQEAYKILNNIELKNQDGTKVKPHYRTDIGE